MKLKSKKHKAKSIKPRKTTDNHISKKRLKRALCIKRIGNFENALKSGALPDIIDTTLSEALVLGLIRQGIKKFITLFGHGSTEIGEVLRIYEEAGVVKTYGMRNEISATHAAMALRWVCQEKAAVVTSIGPGALQALAASLTAASDGVGLWFLFGDETTEDEGPNMQQIPTSRQHSFLQLCSVMGPTYCLHTPHALQAALRNGLNAVDHPYRGKPFFLLLPMNTQCSTIPNFNLHELPIGTPPKLGPAEDNTQIKKAIHIILKTKKIVLKLGGGARNLSKEIEKFIELTQAVAVLSPLSVGVIPFNYPTNMTVGGSKGSLSGNYAMENAEVLVAIGTRFVCQSDCSRTGYPNVKYVININTDIQNATHYNNTIALLGDGKLTLRKLITQLHKSNKTKHHLPSQWLQSCIKKRKEWDQFRIKRYKTPVLFDKRWQRDVLTQPAVISTALAWARENKVISFFDAGDVQANGFQIDESNSIGQVFTETGASYMGWAASALLTTGIANKKFYGLAFCGDGSFTMNPQILIDGINHGAKGCILILDNRRMAAISGLQQAQYGEEHATWDNVNINYVQWANAIDGVWGIHGGYSTKELLNALNKAYSHKNLSLVVVPVYYGNHEMGGMGAFGRWNVGNWSVQTQTMRHKIGL